MQLKVIGWARFIVAAVVFLTTAAAGIGVDTDANEVAVVNELNLEYGWLFPVDFSSSQQQLTLSQDGHYILRDKTTQAIVSSGNWQLLSSNSYIELLTGNAKYLLKINTARHVSLLTAKTQNFYLMPGDTLAEFDDIEDNVTETWQLVKMVNFEFKHRVYPMQRRKVFLTINFADRKLKGSAGCNLYFAGFKLINSFNKNKQLFDIKDLNSSLKFCEQAEVMELEHNYLDQLQRVNSLLIDGDSIVMFNRRDEAILFFQRQKTPRLTAELKEKKWLPLELFSYNKQLKKVQQQLSQPLFIEVAADNKLHGFGGCNSFVVDYNLFADKYISYYAFAKTYQYCSKEVQSIERHYINLLAKASRVELSDKQLVLFDQYGNFLLSFQAAKH